ncbi:hypothetical protein LSH36_79g03022 [Paralvinella palmiformis]|uniref:Alanine racemase C-terminal domain-containing protein n=1 Tax=Paralvinella palmiformis TaxID=53620 RepID=A0AAD9K226_9ANNE|nr:hypothetical protein LSH36_79g03022 [Paralvinella palmiformis]
MEEKSIYRRVTHGSEPYNYLKERMISEVRRTVYIHINLDQLTHNINVLRSMLQPKTGIIGVVKAGAYGHGSVIISHHLKSIGVERLAVGIVDEGIHLRKHHVKGPIHVLGNIQSWEMHDCLRYNLIPNVSDETAILGMVDALNNLKTSKGDVDGNIDYESLGIKRHAANSNGISRGFGTDLDFVRPGSYMYGLPPDNSDEFKAFGISPIARMVAYPTLIKRVPKDTNIGYSSSYKTDKEENIAVFSFGYADGYCRNLTNKGFVIREKTGERCPVIGRVCMDAITVRVPEDTTLSESFTIISADYDPLTSLTGIADTVGGLVFELAANLSKRLPRLYTTRENHWNTSVRALSQNIY